MYAIRSYYAVDGGNSKTEYRLLNASGAVIAAHRGGASNHETLPGGFVGAADVPLKLFAECGIAEERHFGDGQTRYESIVGEQHHDHLICTHCGTILEFENPRIEELQQKVAKEHGCEIRSHRLELYGRCGQCAGK